MHRVHKIYNFFNDKWIKAICRERYEKGVGSMKRNLRFYFALFFAKGTALVLKLIGRQGTSMPGSWAIILCPDFLARMPRPKTVIGITGTNGKTTVSNLVEDVLQECGYQFTCNRAGTNVATGVASSLIANSTFLGKPKNQLAVFELDERSSPHILPYLKPDLLLCTNIFRDSYKRNAHVEFILEILNRYIPDTTRLVLNADDLLCSSLKPENPRAYFSIDPLPGEEQAPHNRVQALRVCPKCGARLEWDFRRYHHIGRVHCPQCGLCSPKPQYRVTAVHPRDHRMTVQAGDLTGEFPLPNGNIINVYNALSAVAVLSEFGLSQERIAHCMEKLTITESRYSEDQVGGRKIILHLAKGQNPIACSQACANVRKAPGKKAVLLFLDDRHDAAHSVENMAWLYDTDLELLNDPSILQVVETGARHWDTYVRLLMAGIPPEKIAHREDNLQAVQALNLEGVDTVYVLYDIYAVGLAKQVKEQLRERLAQLPPLTDSQEKEAQPHEN